jgi:hypothetical protein
MAYVPTNDWKRLAAKRIVAHPMTSKGYPVPLVVLHHTVTPAYPFLSILQGVDSFHQSGVYNDIAYNGAASNTSDEYTNLRGPLVQGGATGKSNGETIDKRSLSLVAVGDFETAGRDVPTDQLVENVARLIVRWILEGHVTRTFSLEPHRNYRSTACCGERLVARIPEIRSRVDEILGTDTITDTEEAMMAVPLINWNTEYIRGAQENTYSAAVELWQKALLAAGMDPGDVDGLVGPKTKAANKWFESKRGTTTPDTFPDNANWRRLLKILETPATNQIVEVERELPIGVQPGLQRIRATVASLESMLDF